MRLDCASDMQRIDLPDPLMADSGCKFYSFPVFLNVLYRICSPFRDGLCSLLKWIFLVLVIQKVRPYQFVYACPNILLYLQLCLGLKPYPELRLVVKRSIKAAIVQINFHYVQNDLQLVIMVINYSQQGHGYRTLRLRSGNGSGNRSLSGAEGSLQLGKEMLWLIIVYNHISY